MGRGRGLRYVDLDVPEYQLSPETGTSWTGSRGRGGNLPTRPLAEGLADYRFHLLGQDATKGKHPELGVSSEPEKSRTLLEGQRGAIRGTNVSNGDSRMTLIISRRPCQEENRAWQRPGGGEGLRRRAIAR